MAWNEPGGGGNRDPWSGGGRDQGPPDLDEVIRKLSDKFGSLLGGRRGGGGGGGGRSGSPGTPSSGFAGITVIVVVIALVGWLIASIYIVDEGTRGVVQRFGRYHTTSMPGPHLRLFPIDRVEIVNVEQRRFREIGYRSPDGTTVSPVRQSAVRSVPQEALMLTQDENIVDVRLAVQYQINDPRAYLFNISEPEAVLVQVVESAARETIGKSTMDFVLTEGRAEIVANIQVLSQRILDNYPPESLLVSDQETGSRGSGMQIVTVVLQDVQPPEEVQDAFADAIKAREDEQRFMNEAEAYANEVIPRARGQATRRLQEASAYREQVIAQAEGEASRFEQLLGAYRIAPEVTRERLYLETIEAVLMQASKVLVDVQGTNNLLYLPLDRLLRSGEASGTGGTRATGGVLSEMPGASASVDDGGVIPRLRDLSRAREVR
jgi:modulator of FtsH protease HflK